MAKKPKMPRKSDDGMPETITLRITEDDRDDFTELFRRMHAAGAENPSTYIKQLLSQVLNPDTTGEEATRGLLRQLGEATSNIENQVAKLDSRTKGLRGTVAKAVVALLVEIADWPLEKAQKFVQEKLLQ